MSRRSQDIPIRPRYGITDELNNDEETKATAQEGTVKSRKTSSSYSEIPFLAQYPGAVPEHVLNDVTPTDIAANVMRADSLEEEDSAGEYDIEDNSKSSSGEANKTQRRPDSLLCDSSVPYELEGMSGAQGEMRHFVAKDLEEKLRIASPQGKADNQFAFASHNSTPSGAGTAGQLTRHFLQTQMPQVDANVLSDIEIEAQYLAASVDNLTENLCNLLHSISSITADNVEVHKNAVNKLTDSMDANIKCMYTIMAKTEEISKSMKPTEQLGQRIREIKRLVDMLDNTM